MRNADCSESDYLLLYTNQPCIVLGKNQSIYKEVSFDYLRSDNLQLARRISGGGTVYQDEGNLSFAFISAFSESKVNNYRLFNRPVIATLLQVGVEAEHDSRNSILYKGKKISGNAQFTNRKNIISHGTLLVNADLDTLRSCLRANEFEIHTAAVSSRSSPVVNISQISSAIVDITLLKNLLIKNSQCDEERYFSDFEWEQIENIARTKYGSLNWIYGRSPSTIIRKPGIELRIEDGVIADIKSTDERVQALIGVLYNYKSVREALLQLPDVSAQLIF